jgi:hypothetical protein
MSATLLSRFLLGLSNQAKQAGRVATKSEIADLVIVAVEDGRPNELPHGVLRINLPGALFLGILRCGTVTVSRTQGPLQRVSGANAMRGH